MKIILACKKVKQMGKLYFEKVVNEDDQNKLYFTSYLRTDFVERSLVVTLDNDDIVKSIYFSSYDFGSAEWVNEHGIVDGRLWESDDQAGAATYLTRRYTVRMANGPATGSFAHEKIVPDVLDNLVDRDFAEIIIQMITGKSSSIKIDYRNMVFLENVN